MPKGQSMFALSPIYSPALLSKHVFLIPESALCLSVFCFTFVFITFHWKGKGWEHLPQRQALSQGCCGTKAVELSEAQPTTLRGNMGP